MSENGTNGTIHSKAAFFEQRQPAVLPVHLDDMAKTVYILKGTVKVARELAEIANNRGEGQQEWILPRQVARILCTPDGQRIAETDEEIERLSEIMTVADMAALLKEWESSHGLTAEKSEQLVKN